jgi:uncharacterized protein
MIAGKHKFNISAEISSKLQPVFARYSELVFVYLFGSLARESAWKTSDVDLAIYVKQHGCFSFSRKLLFHGDCCRVLQRNDVDVVVLNQTRNLLLLEQIIRDGELIMNSDQTRVDDFSLKIQHLALDFRAHRKIVMGI